MANEFIRKKNNNGWMKHSTVPIAMFILPLISLCAGLIMSTQDFANTMGYSSELGEPFYYYTDKSGMTTPIYYPWLIVLAPLKFNQLNGYGSVTPLINESMIYFQRSMYIGFFLFIIPLFLWYALIKKNLFGTARWAVWKDLKRFGLTVKKGCICGQSDRAVLDVVVDKNTHLKRTATKKVAPLIRFNPDFSWLGIAPPRTGKGVSWIIPTLLSYFGSVIVNDPKGENYKKTAGFRKQFSHVLKLSFSDKNSLGINFLKMVRAKHFFKDIDIIANIMLSDQLDKGNEGGNSKHFRENAIDLFRGLLLHVLCSDYENKSLPGVMDFFSSEGFANIDFSLPPEELEEQIRHSGKLLFSKIITSEHTTPEIHDIIVKICKRNLGRDSREQAGVVSTVFRSLTVFDDPVVRECTTRHDFDFSIFVESEHPVSLYLCTYGDDLDRLSNLLRVFFTLGINSFMDGETSFGHEKLKNRLIFILDEFPIIGKMEIVEKAAAFLPGFGVSFFLICQSIKQLEKTYGNSHSFFSQCKLVTALTPAPTDSETAERISKICGKETVIKESSGLSPKSLSNSHNITEQQRELINPDEVLKLPLTDQFIFMEGMPPYIGKKVNYFDDDRFTDLVDLPYPETIDDMKKEIPECFHDSDWFTLPLSVFFDEEREGNRFYVEFSTGTTKEDMPFFDFDEDNETNGEVEDLSDESDSSSDQYDDDSMLWM